MKVKLLPAFLVALGALFALGCARKEPPSAIAAIAKDVSQGVGTVVTATNGGNHRVIVFEETHLSRVGQVEIAIMLHRLHDKYGLRRLSLEGATFDKGALPAKWFHDLNGGDATQDVALRLLREGEISAGEFAALVDPDVEVIGNEKAEEYAVTIDDAGSAAAMQYLLAIAQQSLSQDQIRDANELITQHKEKEALTQIMEGNEWTKERYQKLSDKNSTLSTEDMVALLREIETKANDSGAKIEDQTRGGMKSALVFFQTASDRSNTMIRSTERMFDDGVSLVAIDVGAAHTAKVTDLLTQSGASFAVIRPLSLAEHRDNGAITSAAYDRKVKGDSVDGSGLGAYLNGRGQHKPPPVIGKQWLQSKAEIYHATLLITREAAKGGKPPFEAITPKLALLKAITVDPASYEIFDVHGHQRVIFKVIARLDEKDPSKTVELWGGGWYEPPPLTPGGGQTASSDDAGRPRKSLEQFLMEMREDLMKEQPPHDSDGTSNEVNGEETGTGLLPISTGTKAAFSKSHDAVRAAATSG